MHYHGHSSIIREHEGVVATDEERAQVERICISPLVAVRAPADVQPIGDCVHPYTRQPCPLTAACNRDAIEARPIICRQLMLQKLIGLLQELHLEHVATRSERLLAYLREIDQPVTFVELLAAMGCDASAGEYHAWRGVLHSLRHSERIVAAGERTYRERLYGKQIAVKTWRLA